jgi:hypothetical protein
MAGTSGLVIEESKEQLEGMLKKEKNLKMQQRLQVLYLMQSEKMPILTLPNRTARRNYRLTRI